MNTLFLIVVTAIFATSLSVRDNLVIRALSFGVLVLLLTAILYSVQ